MPARQNKNGQSPDRDKVSIMSANAFHIIIPARYHSTRLPGKLLMDIHGMSVLERVYRQAEKANPASIKIATENEEVAQHARDFGAEVVHTSSHHSTGTDRIAEVVRGGAYEPHDRIVNVQGDEPFIEPALIQQAAEALVAGDESVATLCWPIHSKELFQNPNVVKVVRDKHQHALYFSRSPIPANRDHSDEIILAYRHIGLYAYRVSFLLEMTRSPACDLEQLEGLEQLRILWMGAKIRVEEACTNPLQDINTEEDLMHARASLDLSPT